MQTFNPTQFQTDFPLFANLSTGYLTNTFNNNVLTNGRVIWGLFVGGSDAEYYWATMVLAHILVLTNGQLNQQNGIGKVGVISNVTEGSISGAFFVPATKDSWYWQQTNFGTQCYNLLLQRGGATYYAQPTYNGYTGLASYPYTGYWN